MIIVKNLSKHFGQKSIINDFSYQFPKDNRIAIIGANGAGKTTLLNMIAGIEERDAGEVIIPNGCIIGYLPQVPCDHPQVTILQECMAGNQKLTEMQNKINQLLKQIEQEYSEDIYNQYLELETKFDHNNGYAFESDAKTILSGLGFTQEQFEQSPLDLSGGWRMRLELAKLLMNNPNFILLDEPTNHLDLPSLIWLENYLKSFKGTLLFISHDKEFINNLAEKVIHISNGNVNIYNGNFDNFVEQRETKMEEAKRQLVSVQKKQDQLMEFVNKFKSKASKAKQAQSKLKMIERLKQIENRLDVDDKEKMPVFKLEIDQQSSKVVLEFENGAIGYDNYIINNNLNFKIIRGSKVAIIGTNGIGKSTLLKTIIKQIPLISGKMTLGNCLKIGYYAQDQLDVLNPKQNALDNLLQLVPSLNQQQARSILGNLLITRNDVQKPIGVMSGGEKSKVAMAALLANRNNFLLLDEPTNHLDMSSVEVLANALVDYPGTLIVVSHNRSFIDTFATHILQMNRSLPAELINR